MALARVGRERLAPDAKQITAAASFPPMLHTCSLSTTKRVSRRDAGILSSLLATRAGIVGRFPSRTISIYWGRASALGKTAV